jgi:hypothetical protein
MIELRYWGALCLVVASCSSTEAGDEGGNGTGGAANAGGTAGATSGASGVGGTPPGGGTGTGGGNGGTATGGTPTGGASGASGASGVSGAATGGAATGGGVGGASAGAGMAGGGTAGTSVGGAGSGDSYVGNVMVTVHPEVATVLVVTWNQMTAADDTHLEFVFENNEILRSRAKPGATGMHQDVTLGVPAMTPVTIRIVSRVGTNSYPTRDYMGTTGPLPSGLPVPTVTMYDAARASPEKYLFGGVENTNITAQCTSSQPRSCYNLSTFYTYIMDRRGRMVWYYSDPTSNATSSFQRVARDGDYIWIEKRPYGRTGMRRGVLKMSLDHEYFEEVLISDLADAIDVTTDGSLLYNTEGSNGYLKERTRAGMTRNIWSCPMAMGSGFACYSNTVNWNERDNTIFMSFPDENTIAEIDRVSGMLVATYGDHPGGYTLPSGFTFEFQHFPNMSASGTLMVSSHEPGHNDTYMPTAGDHQFQEFSINRTARTLTQVWMYNTGQEWAMYKGMAIKLANGNVLANYGSGGVIREITQDKQTVFHVKFDDPDGDDFYNKYVGNNVFVADLYALNGGGPRP